MKSPASFALVNARIGDTLLVTPALRAIKAAHPQGTLVVRAHRHRAPVLHGLPFVDRVEAQPPRALRVLDLLAARRYDVAFCWADDAHSLAYCRRVAARTVAFGDSLPSAADVIAVPRPGVPMHAVDERLLLPQALGIAPCGKRLAYVVSPAERTRAQAWIAGQGLTGTPLVGLQLASFPGKAYRDWPLGRFTQLVRELAAWNPRLRFVALGDAAGRERAAALVGASGGRVYDAAGRLALRETAALIAELCLYVGVDTGPTHLAGALDVPMVALYHCYHPGRLLAPLERSALIVIEHPAPAPRCTRETPMAELQVAPVLAACIDLLSQDATRRA